MGQSSSRRALALGVTLYMSSTSLLGGASERLAVCRCLPLPANFSFTCSGQKVPTLGFQHLDYRLYIAASYSSFDCLRYGLWQFFSLLVASWISEDCSTVWLPSMQTERTRQKPRNVSLTRRHDIVPHTSVSTTN